MFENKWSGTSAVKTLTDELCDIDHDWEQSTKVKKERKGICWHLF